MSITLTYPIRETHENLALKKDRTVIAYYRIPNTPITITDEEKKGKHKITVAQMMKKLQKNKFFEISLIPKDYLLEEKMRDFSDALANDSRELGEELLLYTVDRLTNEMEIPYQFDWVVGVTLRKQNHGATVGNKEDIAGKITKNPHIIITGATGQGKSFLAQIIFLSVALQNVKTLYIDPKRELRNHYQEVINSPEFARLYPERKKQIENFNFVTLDSSLPSNHGVLDPIVVLDKEQAVEVAKNMLEFLLQAVDDVTMDQKTAITEAINAIVEKRVAGEKVGFKHVLKVLRDSTSSEIASVGRYLTSIVTNSILELAFSDGTTRGLNYESRVTILEVNNLKLPKDDSTKISDHERNSITLMFALGAFCTHFGERNENEDTIEFFDEAWILMKSAEGKAVIKNMRRIGRSKNNTLALITQSVHDAENDDDTTGFGTIFAFYEKSEREDILKHVNLEVTESNLEWIDNMISGQCLYYDVYGNLNMISVHNIFEDIDMLLKPMKATVSSSLENKYAS